jgi:hypothetical protein
VAARQALVKRLRSEGDRERAAEVAKLRRPTAAAWAVNELTRRHPDEVAELIGLGEELRRAHEQLLAGARDDARALTSGRRRREAIASLVERAAGLLTESGRAADAHRDAISSTLDAASLDPDVGTEVLAGRLSKEVDPPSGFGVGVGDGELAWSAPPRPAAAPVETPPAAKPGTPAAAAAEKPAADEGAADRRQEDARQRATSARTAATRARDLADRARDAADHAERERDRLEIEVVRARSTANDSRRAARELRDAAHEAERQATALERDADT